MNRIKVLSLFSIYICLYGQNTRFDLNMCSNLCSMQAGVCVSFLSPLEWISPSSLSKTQYAEERLKNKLGGIKNDLYFDSSLRWSELDRKANPWLFFTIENKKLPSFFDQRERERAREDREKERKGKKRNTWSKLLSSKPPDYLFFGFRVPLFLHTGTIFKQKTNIFSVHWFDLQLKLHLFLLIFRLLYYLSRFTSSLMLLVDGDVGDGVCYCCRCYCCCCSCCCCPRLCCRRSGHCGRERINFQWYNFSKVLLPGIKVISESICINHKWSKMHLWSCNLNKRNSSLNEVKEEGNTAKMKARMKVTMDWEREREREEDEEKWLEES